MSGLRDTACQTASRIEVGLQLCRDWSKPPLRYVECGKKNIKDTFVTVYILIREKWFCIIPLVGRYGLDFFIWKTGKMFPFSYILFCYLMLISLQIFWQQKKQSCSKHPWQSWIQDDVWWNYGGIMWRHSTRIPFSDQDDHSLIFLTTKRVAHHWLLCCFVQVVDISKPMAASSTNGGSLYGRFRSGDAVTLGRDRLAVGEAGLEQGCCCRC